MTIKKGKAYMRVVRFPFFDSSKVFLSLSTMLLFNFDT